MGPLQWPVAYLSKKILILWLQDGHRASEGWQPQSCSSRMQTNSHWDKHLMLRFHTRSCPLTSVQGYRFLSNSQLTQYQGLLYENPSVTLKTVRTLNLATFLPTEEGEPDHDCSEVVDEVYTSRLDLQDQAITSPEITLFSDGSSYLQKGSRRAGYAVTTTTEVLEAKALLEGWSAQ